MITDIKELYNNITFYDKCYTQICFVLANYPDIFPNRYFLGVRAGQIGIKNIEISNILYNKIAEFTKMTNFQLLNIEQLLIQERNSKLQKI